MRATAFLLIAVVILLCIMSLFDARSRLLSAGVQSITLSDDVDTSYWDSYKALSGLDLCSDISGMTVGKKDFDRIIDTLAEAGYNVTFENGMIEINMYWYEAVWASWTGKPKCNDAIGVSYARYIIPLILSIIALLFVGTRT